MPSVRKSVWATIVVAASSAALHRSRPGRSRSGSVGSRYRAVSSPSAAPAAICAVPRPSSPGSASAGAAVGSTPTSASPRPFVPAGTQRSPAPSRPESFRRPATVSRGRAARAGRGRAGRGGGGRGGRRVEVEDREPRGGGGEGGGEQKDRAGGGPRRLGQVTDL